MAKPKHECDPQFPEDQRDEPVYSNIAKGWVRGAPAGKEPNMKNEDGTQRPGFDKNSRTGKL